MERHIRKLEFHISKVSEFMISTYSCSAPKNKKVIGKKPFAPGKFRDLGSWCFMSPAAVWSLVPRGSGYLVQNIGWVIFVHGLQVLFSKADRRVNLDPDTWSLSHLEDRCHFLSLTHSSHTCAVTNEFLSHISSILLNSCGQQSGGS